MRLVIGSLRQQESFYISNSTKGGRLGRVKLKRAGEVAQVKGPHLRFGLFSNWIEGPWACFCKGGLVASQAWPKPSGDQSNKLRKRPFDFPRQANKQTLSNEKSLCP